MPRSVRAMALSVLAAAMSAFAQAQTTIVSTCNAQTHSRFGETRVFFKDALGACRPDGFCSALITIADPSAETAYHQQLRVARPEPAAPYLLELIAVTPNPTLSAKPQTLTFARDVIDLTPVIANEAGTANSYRVTDQATTDRIVGLLKAGRTVRWTYTTTEAEGRYTATFPLRGITAALDWIDCQGSIAAKP